jgi:hypothetical protein
MRELENKVNKPTRTEERKGENARQPIIEWKYRIQGLAACYGEINNLSYELSRLVKPV